MRKLSDLTVEDLRAFFAYALGDYQTLVKFELVSNKYSGENRKFVCLIKKTPKNPFEGKIFLREDGWCIALGEGTINEYAIREKWKDYLLREGILPDDIRLSITAGELRQMYDMMSITPRINPGACRRL